MLHVLVRRAGYAAIESFAQGTPVVSTRTQGVSDYGVDGTNILLAKPNDPGDLFEKLNLLLVDGNLRNSLRKNAYATAQPYTWDKAMESFEYAQSRMLEEFH